MNRQQVLLALALCEADVPIKVEKFDDRLVVQKAVYLLQERGVHIGYRYRWYLRGPYSSDLASDAFTFICQGDEAQKELSRWELDPQSRKRIKDIRGLFSTGSSTSRPKHLELLASVLFLIRTGQAHASDTKRISEILKINDKPFSVEQVSSAVAELEEYGFSL